MCVREEWGGGARTGRQSWKRFGQKKLVKSSSGYAKQIWCLVGLLSGHANWWWKGRKQLIVEMKWVIIG